MQQLFIEKVNRITDEDVHCVGFLMQSDTVRSIRERWLAEVPQEHHITHNRYPGEGHISLVYFHGQYRSAVEEALASLQEELIGSRVALTRVFYQSDARELEEIQLASLRWPISSQLLCYMFKLNFVEEPATLWKCSGVCAEWRNAALSGDIQHCVWSVQCRQRCMCGVSGCDMCFPAPYDVNANLDYKALFAGGDYQWIEATDPTLD